MAISEDERARTVARLRALAVDGQLTLEEFSDRVGEVYAASDAAALEAVTASLPAPELPVSRPRRRLTTFVLSVFGSADRRGRWRVGERLTTVTLMGGNDLDLRGAELDGDELTVTAVAVLGGIDIYVPDSMEVDVSGFALAGSNGDPGGRAGSAGRTGMPVVRVRAWSVMGSVDVWRLPPDAPGSLREARRMAKTLGHG